MRRLLRAPERWAILLAFATILLSVHAGAGMAEASQQPNIELSVPIRTTVGDRIDIEATLSAADGSPITGVQVIFYLPVVFANVSDEIEIGRSITDERGMASIRYVPRQWGEQQVVARFAGDNAFSPMATSATLLVAPGPQVYQEESGVDLPGLGVWVLAVALTAVWGVLLGIVGLLLLIATRREHILPYRYHRRAFK